MNVIETLDARFADDIVWDAHTCLPLRFGQSMEDLERHRQVGVNFVSVNVGMDFNPLSQVVRLLAQFRRWIGKNDDRFCLAGSVEDIRAAKREGRLAIAFDLEGSAMLEDDVAMLGFLYEGGVRQISLAYNRDNSISGGCHGAGTGLTPLGREVVAEANKVGLVLDGSHMSEAASLELIQLSTAPVVFSHSNARSVFDHPRNISDCQIDACAAAGGVIGVNGLSGFVGPARSPIAGVFRHLDYLCSRVGPDHVGLGLDFVFDEDGDEFPTGFDRTAWWPPTHYEIPSTFLGPECIHELVSRMVAAGYPDDAVRNILGLNFARVASAVWHREG